MKYTVRQATKEDFVTIYAVLTEAADWLRSMGMPMWQNGELEPEKLSRSADSFYIAEDMGGSSAGVVMLTTEKDEFWPDVSCEQTLFLHRLAIRRAHAGHGLSRFLLDFAIQKAKSMGFRFVRLDCASDRLRLRAVYEDFGFTHHSDKTVDSFHVARYEFEISKTA
jgi:GNAT superfamily N-acetyltransferase